MVAVARQESQLGTRRGFHPPDDEPHRGRVGIIPEGPIGNVGGFRHIGGAVHTVGYWRPICLGYPHVSPFHLLSDYSVVDRHASLETRLELLPRKFGGAEGNPTRNLKYANVVEIITVDTAGGLFATRI